MVISDNSPGLPLDFDIEKSNSLGLVLVNSLVEQLEGIIGLEIKIKQN